MLTRFALVLSLWLTACTSHPAQKQDFPLPASTEEVPQPTLLPITPEIIQVKMTEIAVADLSQRLGMDPEAVGVISAESIVWPDFALGCPLPGKVSAQGRVPGFRVLLEAGGQVYEYHTDESGQVIQCEMLDLPEIPVTPGEIDDGQPWMPVN